MAKRDGSGGTARSLVGAGFAVAFVRVFSLACAAIQLALLTRLLSPAEYSAVAIAIAIATYFSLLSAEPVILGFERFPGASSDRPNYQYAMTRTVAYTALATVVVAAAAFPLGLVEEAIAFAGWGIGIAVNRLVSLAWLMWERPWQYAWNLAAGTGTRTAVLVSLVLLGWSPLVSLGAAGVAAALAALFLSPRTRLRFRHESGSRPWPFKFGLNLAIASLAYAALSNANLLILAAFAPSSVVGTYAVMTQVATLTSASILGLVLAIAYPPLRRAWDIGRQSLVQMNLIRLQMSCLAIASACLFACHVGDQFLLKLIIPVEYIDPAVLAPLLLSTAFATMGGMASWRHQLELRAGRVARRTFIATLAGSLLTIGLTALFDQRGAAIGSLLGFALYLGIMQVGTRLPFAPLIVAVLASIATSGYLFNPAISSNWVSLPAITIALGTALAALRPAGMIRLSSAPGDASTS